MVASKKELKTGIKAKKKIAHAHLSECAPYKFCGKTFDFQLKTTIKSLM